MNPSNSFEDVYHVQTAELTRLRAEVEALKAENARLHTANERMRAALERVRCRDWAPDWVRDIANRALEGGE